MYLSARKKQNECSECSLQATPCWERCFFILKWISGALLSTVLWVISSNPQLPAPPQHSSSHPPQQSFPPPQHFSPRLLLTFRTSNLLLRELSEISRGDGSLNLSLEMRWPILAMWVKFANPRIELGLKYHDPPHRTELEEKCSRLFKVQYSKPRRKKRTE